MPKNNVFFLTFYTGHYPPALPKTPFAAVILPFFRSQFCRLPPGDSRVVCGFYFGWNEAPFTATPQAQSLFGKNFCRFLFSRE